MKHEKTISEQKNEFREKAKAALKKLSSGFDKDLRSMLATTQFISSELYTAAECLFVFMSKTNEISTKYVIDKALADKKAVALPRVCGKTLDFYLLNGEESIDSQLERGKFDIYEPLATLSKVDSARLPVNTVLLMPGLAFSLSGARLGYGKGFYDRFIDSVYRSNSPVYLPKAIVGFGFDCQLFDSLPVDEYDILLTHVVTEKQIITC